MALRRNISGKIKTNGWGVKAATHQAFAPHLAFAGASLCGAALLGVAAAVLWGAETAPWAIGAVLAVYLAASVLAVRAISQSYPHPRLGLCNLVTLGRMVLVGILGVALLQGVAPNPSLLALAVVALCLDGVDGGLARWQGLSSDFGARFDVEVDAGFALTLALLATTGGATGPFVVLLGLPHYVFAVARRVWPWLEAPLPPKFSRKLVCVVQIATLIALLVPGFGGPMRDGLVLVAVLALAWSFGRDILWLYRTRA